MTGAALDLYRVDSVAITLDPAPLVLEVEHMSEIEAAWQAARAALPSLYDGRAFLVDRWQISSGALTARCHETRFATLLWLRALDPPLPSVVNAFGSAMLRTRDGAVILAEMSADTANAGRIYCPGGILDAADLSDGQFDMATTIRREMMEETGLAASELSFRPGFLVVRDAARMAVTQVVDLPWAADEAVAEISGRIAEQSEPELAALHVMRRVGDADRPAVPAFVRRMLAEVLPA